MSNALQCLQVFGYVVVISCNLIFTRCVVFGRRTREPAPVDATQERLFHRGNDALMLTYLASTPAMILAPSWASAADIQSALEMAFPEGVPRNGRAQIRIEWTDYDARSFDVVRDLGPHHRQVTVREGQVTEDISHYRPDMVPVRDSPVQAENVAGSGTSPAPPTKNLLLATKQITAEDEEPKCAICLEEKEIGDTVTMLQCACSIVYDRDCIAFWLREQDTCPFCRRSVKTRQPPPDKGRMTPRQRVLVERLPEVVFEAPRGLRHERRGTPRGQMLARNLQQIRVNHAHAAPNPKSARATWLRGLGLPMPWRD